MGVPGAGSAARAIPPSVPGPLPALAGLGLAAWTAGRARREQAAGLWRLRRDRRADRAGDQPELARHRAVLSCGRWSARVLRCGAAVAAAPPGRHTAAGMDGGLHRGPRPLS